MTKESKKPKTTAKKSPKTTALAPLDIGLPKSGLVSGKKAMDIVPKGKTLPSSSAKPVIVSHRTVVKDPMAPPELTDVPSSDTPKKLKKKPKIVIAPLHDDIQPEDTSVAAEDVLEDEQSSDDPTEANDQYLDSIQDDGHTDQIESDAKPEEPDKTAEGGAKEPEEVVDEGETDDDDAEAIKKSTEPKQEELERKRAEKRAEEAEALIASKKYFLPINSVKKRRSMQLVWFVLLLLVAGAVVVGLLDAEILTFMSAPTDFI